MNVPNIITMVRFGLIPLFIFVVFSSYTNGIIYGLVIFLTAGATDMLDGYIARKYNLITKWGQVMDPLADKLMLLTVLICFTVKDLFPSWVIFMVGLKELTMVIGGIFLYTRREKAVVPANRYGKLTTVFFYVVVFWGALQLPYLNWIAGAAVLFAGYAFVNYLLLAMKLVKAQA